MFVCSTDREANVQCPEESCKVKGAVLAVLLSCLGEFEKALLWIIPEICEEQQPQAGQRRLLASRTQTHNSFISPAISNKLLAVSGNFPRCPVASMEMFPVAPSLTWR